MKSGSGDTTSQSYKAFCYDYGVPEHLDFYGSIAQLVNITLFINTINKYDKIYHVSNQIIPDEKPTESSISEIKKRCYRIMLKNKVPKSLWDYGLICICETVNISDSSSRYATGRTPLE